MRIHPLFSVKKAAEVLGVDKQFLRDQLVAGSIRGEQRRVGERDKWFIYHGEVRDLRDTKRLHELLEKAKRISTEDLADFFQPETETENGTIDEESLVEAIVDTDEQSTIKLGGAAATKDYSHAETFVGTDLVPSTEVFSPAELIAAIEALKEPEAFSQAEPLVFAEPITDSDATMPSETLHTVEVLTPSDIKPDVEVQNVIPEVQVEPELEHFTESVSGSTSITLDEVLQKLTVEFAYRLSEERTRVCELEQLLEQKEESLRQLPDLEKQLKLEQETRQSHEAEVATLQEKIRLLEEKQAAPKKSWWQSLFG